MKDQMRFNNQQEELGIRLILQIWYFIFVQIWQDSLQEKIFALMVA